MQKSSKNALFFAGFLVFIIIGIIISFFFNNDFWALRNNPFNSTKLNILLIGYDSIINGSPRADTIMVASIDLKAREVGILSIPRDTRVSIPGHGMNRINASYAFGGVDLTKRTLESFLNIGIDYYIETDFKGFAQIIDAIGGVEININKPLHYVDKAGGLYINLPAGKQKLDGQKALQYVRYREEIKGDIGRVERQQIFLKAVLKRVLSPDIIVKLPSIYSETKKAVDTNIPLQDINPFIKLIKEINMQHIKTVMLPGEPRYINGASYWIANKQELDILVNNLIRSKEYIKNSNYKITVFNGNGQPGLATEVSEDLIRYGFKISRIANADNFNYQETIVKYFERSDENLAENIKKVIGGKIEYVKNEEDQKDDNLEIIIGADYKKSD